MVIADFIVAGIDKPEDEDKQKCPDDFHGRKDNA